MKLYLIKFIVVFFILLNQVNASTYDNNYIVSASGIKIGKFSWFLDIDDGNYYSEINLKSSGILSAIYKFNGKYVSKGIIKEGNFKSKEYTQYWETNKKTKIIEISFNDHPTKFTQKPKEKELSRIDIYKLFEYFDPITSFISILSGETEAKTLDGRRIYIMKKTSSNKSGNIEIVIKSYKNIWADHKRSDLKKIEFHVEEEGFLPDVVLIYFKERVFKLIRN